MNQAHRQGWKPRGSCIESQRPFRSVVFIVLGCPFRPGTSSVLFKSLLCLCGDWKEGASLLLRPFTSSTALLGCKTPPQEMLNCGASGKCLRMSSEVGTFFRSHLQAGFGHSALCDILPEVSTEKRKMWLKLARGHLENRADSSLRILSCL